MLFVVTISRNLFLDLEEQIAFLTSSSNAYDQGMHIEAKRLAVTMRVLLHDTGASRSLLGQIGVKDRLRWTCAGSVDPEDLAPSNALTWFAFGHNGDGTAFGRHIPVREDYIRENVSWLWFDEWWQTPVIKDSHREVFSRADLIKILANKDGGAHIDELQNRVRRLAHEGSLGWAVATSPDPSAPAHTLEFELVSMNPILAAVRTIATEVIMTLESQRLLLGFPHFPGRWNSWDSQPAPGTQPGS